tara:strand:- start:5765 stop:5908 length:144 start_codon:yes stop_codon:yes gene_type:complete
MSYIIKSLSRLHTAMSAGAIPPYIKCRDGLVFGGLVAGIVACWLVSL